MKLTESNEAIKEVTEFLTSLTGTNDQFKNKIYYQQTIDEQGAKFLSTIQSTVFHLIKELSELVRPC